MDTLRPRHALELLACETRITLMPFAPVIETLVGEPPKIFAGLGWHTWAKR